MKINAQVFQTEKENSKVKATAAITVNDSLAIKNVRVVEGENGLFVQLPQYMQTDKSYENLVFPVTKELREQINSTVLEQYHNPTEKENPVPQETKIKVSASPLNIENSSIRALCSVTLDDSLVIKNVRVMEGQKGLFVQMPSYKDRQGNYIDIVFPVTKEFREKLFGAVLESYQNKLATIGNATYGELKEKGDIHYAKVDNKNLAALEKALDNAGISYTGRKGEETTVITINSADVDSFRKAENSLKQQPAMKK